MVQISAVSTVVALVKQLLLHSLFLLALASQIPFDFSELVLVGGLDVVVVADPDRAEVFVVRGGLVRALLIRSFEPIPKGSVLVGGSAPLRGDLVSEAGPRRSVLSHGVAHLRVFGGPQRGLPVENRVASEGGGQVPLRSLPVIRGK